DFLAGAVNRSLVRGVFHDNAEPGDLPLAFHESLQLGQWNRNGAFLKDIAAVIDSHDLELVVEELDGVADVFAEVLGQDGSEHGRLRIVAPQAPAGDKPQLRKHPRLWHQALEHHAQQIALLERNHVRQAGDDVDHARNLTDLVAETLVDRAIETLL